MDLYLHTPEAAATAPGTGYNSLYHALHRALAATGIKLTDTPVWQDLQVSLAPTCTGCVGAVWTTRWCTTQLIFTMTERGALPDGWAEQINESEGLIVPSRWCADLYGSLGVRVPIHKVPLGIDPKRWKPVERPIDRETFTFLWQGVHYLDRKGGELVRSTFRKLQAGSPSFRRDARLIMKWTKQHSLPYRSDGYQTRHMLEIGDYVTDEEMDNLIWRSDCSVNPSGGEGFGLIPLEHMATGLPAIITSATGQVDYMGINGDGTSPVCYPLKWTPNTDRKKSAVLGPHVVPEVFPDTDHLGALMEHCFEHREEARSKGKRASEWAHQNWTWDRSAQALLAAIAPRVETQVSA